MKFTSVIAFGLLTTLSLLGQAQRASAPATKPAPSGERFEVSSIKAVRPTLVNTIAALQKRDIANAKAAFEAFDSGWNGIEVYISTRDPEMYGTLEQGYQARIAKGLTGPNPDTATLLADAQAMLAKYDEAVRMIEKAAPLNSIYDDVARLRIVRAHLRDVNPALKAGDMTKARKSFDAFNDRWDSIEDLVKARSSDAYTAIERGMIQIERALMPVKPDLNQVTSLVSGVMDQYNAIVAQVTREARSSR